MSGETSDETTTSPARRDATSLGEVIDSVKLYARQETVGPLKGAGRWIALGAAGAILLGFGILMLGDGLQSTLLGVRASLEGFPTAITGLIMSTFYVGFLAGALYSPRFVERVGHIRVFGALASVASASVLSHSPGSQPLKELAGSVSSAVRT